MLLFAIYSTWLLNFLTSYANIYCTLSESEQNLYFWFQLNTKEECEGLKTFVKLSHSLVNQTIRSTGKNSLCATSSFYFLFVFFPPHFENTWHYSSVLWISLAAYIYKKKGIPKTHGMYDSLPAVSWLRVESFSHWTERPHRLDVLGLKCGWRLLTRLKNRTERKNTPGFNIPHQTAAKFIHK